MQIKALKQIGEYIIYDHVLGKGHSSICYLAFFTIQFLKL